MPSWARPYLWWQCAHAHTNWKSGLNLRAQAGLTTSLSLSLSLTINNPIITTRFLPLARDHSVIRKQSLVAEWSWARISSAHWIDWGWYGWWSSSVADALRPCWRIAFEGRIDPQQFVLCWGCRLAVSAGPKLHLGRVWFGVGHMPLTHTPKHTPETSPWNTTPETNTQRRNDGFEKHSYSLKSEPGFQDLMNIVRYTIPYHAQQKKTYVRTWHPGFD